MRETIGCLAPLVAAAILAGCSRGDWEAVRYESGDTTVVRTVSGSVWGGPATLVEKARIDPDAADSTNRVQSVRALAVGPRGDVYVVDQETPAVRSYSEDGEHRGVFAAPMGEPGWYKSPNGVAVLSDGRVVIRDPRLRSLLIYSPRGVFLESWRHPAFDSPSPLLLDDDGRLYTSAAISPRDSAGMSRPGMLRYSSDGASANFIPDPEFDYRPPTLFVVSSYGDTVWFSIPLYPRAHWARSPTGDIIRGISNGYAFDVLRPDGGVIRIEREFKPVEALEEERFALYHEVDRQARQIDYRWTWGGPVVPETKPPYKGIFADRDGRIWVQLHQLAQLRTEESDREQPSADDFVEPVAFDVFKPDGTYLGQVSAPPGFRTMPQPVMQGNTVWGAVGESGTVPSVVRFEIVH